MLFNSESPARFLLCLHPSREKQSSLRLLHFITFRCIHCMSVEQAIKHPPSTIVDQVEIKFYFWSSPWRLCTHLSFHSAWPEIDNYSLQAGAAAKFSKILDGILNWTREFSPGTISYLKVSKFPCVSLLFMMMNNARCKTLDIFLISTVQSLIFFQIESKRR